MSSNNDASVKSQVYDLDNYEGHPPHAEPGITDWYSPGLLVVLGVVFLIPSIQLEVGTLSRPGPGMWPAINAGILLLMAPLVLIARHKFKPPQYQGLLRVIGVTIPLLLFVPMYNYMGIIGAGFVLVFIVGRFVGRLGWVGTVLAAVFVPVCVYFLFSVALGVTLRGF